jgi:hypothetical protein
MVSCGTVNLEKTVNGGFGRIGLEHVLLPCPGQALPQLGVGEQALNLSRQVFGITVPGNETGLFVKDYLGNATRSVPTTADPANSASTKVRPNPSA